MAHPHPNHSSDVEAALAIWAQGLSSEELQLALAALGAEEGDRGETEEGSLGEDTSRG